MIFVWLLVALGVLSLFAAIADLWLETKVGTVSLPVEDPGAGSEDADVSELGDAREARPAESGVASADGRVLVHDDDDPADGEEQE